MYTAFSTALSALKADSSAIDIIGNNLANLNTTGYKSTDIEFSNLMSEMMGSSANPTQIGMGVGPVGSLTQYSQGTFKRPAERLTQPYKAMGSSWLRTLVTRHYTRARATFKWIPMEIWSRPPARKSRDGAP